MIGIVLALILNLFLCKCRMFADQFRVPPLTGIFMHEVNIVNYLTTDAAVIAARKLGVNLIIQTSAGTVEHFGAKKFYDMIDAVRKEAPEITVAIHLDHCRKTELGKTCVDSGWDAVMMDFSHLPLEESTFPLLSKMPISAKPKS